MDNHRQVLVLSAARTAIGKFGGALAPVPPCDLAATAVREVVSRAGVEPGQVGHAVFGNVIHTEVRDMYLSRVDDCHMGVTAETVATEHGISRADQDALAAESHRRASAAAQAGYFKEQIVPVEVPARKGAVTVDADEHIRPGVTTEDLARLRPSFAADGTVTPGNASGINDAAAAVVLAEEGFASDHGPAPLGRLIAYSHAGVEPRIMGIGPVSATRKVLDRAGLKLDEIASGRRHGCDPRRQGPV